MVVLCSGQHHASCIYSRKKEKSHLTVMKMAVLNFQLRETETQRSGYLGCFKKSRSKICCQNCKRPSWTDKLFLLGLIIPVPVRRIISDDSKLVLTKYVLTERVTVLINWPVLLRDLPLQSLCALVYTLHFLTDCSKEDIYVLKDEYTFQNVV